MPRRLLSKFPQLGVIALVAGALAACTTTPAPESDSAPAPVNFVPKMGFLREEIAGQQRLFSTFGFWMLSEPLKSQLLGCFRPDATLDRTKLRQTLPDAKIVAGTKVVAVALPAGDFTFFLLQDGPLISLDPKFDTMVQQMSVKAYTSP